MTTTPSPAVSDPRRDQLSAWLRALPAELRIEPDTLQPASVDASFRRYFRVDASGGTLIVMDAPPGKEDVGPFIRVAGMLRDAGLNAPRVIESDAQQGFLLLSDLGQQTFLDVLNESNAAALFADAAAALIRWQLATRPGALPPYDEVLLRRELALFPDWYVARHLGRSLTAAQRQTLEDMFDRIVAANLAQPTVFVHRDYMPRNLMVSSPSPGVIDFQDAVIGPVTYDLASLFRDAFISWDEERIIDWAIRYWEAARRARLPVGADFASYWRDFEWMGLQRHLKVLGIFARINYRDGKPHYLADTPRFVGYVRAVARRYDELAPLARLFDELEGATMQTGYTF
jgi:N-acetylmuramate 1-kinase